jgi:hypothetical protein
LRVRLRFGLKAKCGGIVATVIAVDGIVIATEVVVGGIAVGAMRYVVSLGVSLRLRHRWIRSLSVRRLMARMLVKVRREPMVDGGGVVVVDGGVGGMARSCHRFRMRLVKARWLATR